jgi:hypothetical protein
MSCTPIPASAQAKTIELGLLVSSSVAGNGAVQLASIPGNAETGPVVVGELAGTGEDVVVGKDRNNLVS